MCAPEVACDKSNKTTIDAGSICFHETRFENVYQRNNKRGGLKNLRCFPICGSQHKTRGFCGRSVKAKISMQDSSREILVWGRFVRVDPNDEPIAGPNPIEGEEIPIAIIAELERDSITVTKPFVRGDIISKDNKECVVEFNKKLKGWHYGWAANKHSCNAQHCFQLYVFEKLNETDMKCVITHQSPHFMVFCRRRKRFQVVPSAPIAPINLARRKLPHTMSDSNIIVKPMKKSRGVKRRSESVLDYGDTKLLRTDQEMLLSADWESASLSSDESIPFWETSDNDMFFLGEDHDDLFTDTTEENLMQNFELDFLVDF